MGASGRRTRGRLLIYSVADAASSKSTVKLTLQMQASSPAVVLAIRLADEGGWSCIARLVR